MKCEAGLKLKQKLRFLVLGLICLSLYASNYIFDLPAVMKQDIINNFTPVYGEELTLFYFSFLYSFYSIPNIILPVFGGVFIDKFGYRVMGAIFMSLVVLGQMTIYFGCLYNDLRVMVLGRFLFGLGGETLGITSGIQQVVWFGGKELSFASSLIVSLVRTSSVLNTILTPQLVEFKGMSTAFGFGFLLTIFSFMSLLLLNKIDLEVEKQLNIQPKQQNTSIDLFVILRGIIEQIKKFSKMYWNVVFLIMVFQAGLQNFISFSGPIITDLWLPKSNSLEHNIQIAGELMGVPYLCCTFLCPLIGLYIDANGQRTKVIMCSLALLFLGLTMLLYVFPLLTMIILGISYSLFVSTIWTSITFIVPRDQLGAAYGVISALCNLFAVIVPVLIAIIANFGTSVSLVMFFMMLSLIGTLLSIMLYLEDKQRPVSLDDPNQEKLMNYLRQSQNSDNILDAIDDDDEEVVINDQPPVPVE